MTRLKKITGFMAVMLCVTAFLFPMTAYALSDSTPPTISARINGDMLHAEASDTDSGVEAVYVNGSRYNYLVDGAIDIPLKDCAGTGEYISVHALDFAGNKSKTVQLNNPYYVAPAKTPPPTGTTPAPAPTQPPSTPTPAPTQRPPASTAPTPTPTPEPTPESTQSAVPDAQQPFTPDGTGTVVDNIMETNGKEFFTIETPDGNIFYLIIDRQRDENGVYLLNAVTEDDLQSLAKEGDGKSENAVPTPEPTTPQVQPTPDPEPEPTPEPPAKDSGSTGTIILVLLAVAAVGGAGWYFKIYRPKQQAAEPEDMDEDELDFEDEPEETEDGEDEYPGDEADEDTGDDYEDEE